MTRRSVVPCVLLMLLAGLAALPASSQPVVGGEAPGFSLAALDGSTINHADLRGRIVVIHFGAGW